MKWIATLLVLLLAACGPQPTPLMFGATKTEVTRNGRDYVVFQKGEAVEVIRLGYVRPGQHQGIRRAMVDLIPEVTGCWVDDRFIQGDSGEMRAKVRCPDR